MKKRLCLLLCAAMLFCGGCSGAAPDKNAGDVPDPYSHLRSDYNALSDAIYADALGDFLETYTQAKEAATVAQRYVRMAQAEAKLLCAGVMLPLSGGGGTYAISRLAPYSTPNVLWGSDEDRLHTAIVTTQPITAAHRTTMKTEYNRRKGTGTYEDWALDYLTGQGYTIKDSYTMTYTADPETWDVLATSKSVDIRAVVNTYEGLYTYDPEGVLQPGLAQSCEKTENPDGTVSYTFTLRSGLYWTDSQGRQLAPIRADDFVAGMQHMMDAMGGLEYLTEGVILGAREYISGEDPDFSHVGVHAPNDTTLVYTLESDIPYFMTMLGYSVFAPLCRSYYQSRGGKFGSDYDGADPGYTYGRSPDAIAYCGPYLITNATARSTIAYRQNPAWRNAENLRLKKITWLYNDGSEELKAYHDVRAGVIDNANLNASAVAKAKSDGVFDSLAFVTDSNATTYFMFLNLNRTATGNFNDPTVGASPKDAVDLARSRMAMGNANFRRALCLSLDRGTYNGQSVGQDLQLAALRNSYTPGNFVTLPEDVTLDGVTYQAGTPYGALLQQALEAEGMPIRVWDESARAGAGDSDGFDGWYDPAKAMAFLEQALVELSAQGLTVTPETPVYIDFPYDPASASGTNMANVCKQSVEAALGGYVRVNPVDCRDRTGINYAGYFITEGSQANYDLYGYAGWGPDYGDPQTYLDTVLPRYAGYMTRMFGIY